MMTSTFSSRQFNQDTASVKRAAKSGPVIITDRGKPAHVLMTYDDYQKLSAKEESVLDVMAMPGDEDIEFDPPKMELVAKPADLS